MITNYEQLQLETIDIGKRLKIFKKNENQKNGKRLKIFKKKNENIKKMEKIENFQPQSEISP